MKFLIKLIICLTLFIIINVNAETINVEESSEYLLKSNNVISPLKIYSLEDTGELLYSKDIYSLLNNNKVLTKSHDYSAFLNIRDEDWQNITNILYFGYLYNNHTDFKWYVLTQYFLYQALNIDVSIIHRTGMDIKDYYFLEYQEYESLLNNYIIVPSFFNGDINVNYGEKIILEDLNGVVDLYNIIPSGYINLKESNGDYYLSFKKPCIGKILGVRKINERHIPKIYFNLEVTLFERTVPTEVIYSSNVYVHGGKIKVINTDIENQILYGAKYKLYNSRDELVTTLQIGATGYAETDYLVPDNYYLIEEVASNGYVLNKDKITIEFNDFNTTEVVVSSKKITGSVVINLFNRHINSSKNEGVEDSKFVLENLNGDILQEGVTDKNGTLIFQVIPGNYYLKQVSSKYPLIEDKLITVLGNDEVLVEHVNISKNYQFLLSSDKKLAGFDNFYIFNVDTLEEMLIDDYVVYEKEIVFSLNLDYGNYALKFDDSITLEDIYVSINAESAASLSYKIKTSHDNNFSDGVKDLEDLKNEDSDLNDEIDEIVVPMTSKNIPLIQLFISFIFIVVGYRIYVKN